MRWARLPNSIIWKSAIEVREMELDIMDTETEADNLTQDFAVLLGFDHLYFEENHLTLRGLP